MKIAGCTLQSVNDRLKEYDRIVGIPQVSQRRNDQLHFDFALSVDSQKPLCRHPPSKTCGSNTAPKQDTTFGPGAESDHHAISVLPPEARTLLEHGATI